MSGNSDSARQHQLDEVLAALMRASDAGEPIDPVDWLSRHPDFSHELKEFFQQHERVEKLVGPLRQAAAHVLHVRCPHCHNPIELLEEAPLTDISCPSCGSSFSLVGEHAQSHFQPGEKSLGHFQLLDRVGVGQFGSVWKARDTKLDRTVAIKIPRSESMDEAQTEMFLRDARAAAQLKHPNIVGVHEVGKQDDTVYIVSDFIQGANLKDWEAAKRLTPREAAQLCIKVAQALHHAHEAGVIHRDLKPGNIMMNTDGEPHIVDFGLAKRDAGEITMTLEGQILGTPAYMSPEQARGEGHSVDRRSDIYSLGVILFELLTGELPFRGDKEMLIVQILKDEPPPPRQLNSSVPRDLDTICSKCLEKEPSQRFYQTAAEVAWDLDRFLRREPIHARPCGTSIRLIRWTRRRPAVAACLSLSFVTAMLLVAVAISRYYNRELSSVNSRLELANLHLSEKRAEADREREGAFEKEELARRHMYAANIVLAQRAVEAGDSSQAYEILDRLREDDTAGLRGFEWHHLWNAIRGNSDVICKGASDVHDLVCQRSLLFVGRGDGTVAIWDRDSRELLYELRHNASITSLIAQKTTPDVTFSDGNRAVWRWYPTEGEVVAIDRNDSIAAGLLDRKTAVSPDGSAQVTVTRNGALVFGDAVTKETVRRGHLWMLSSQVAYSADGKFIAVAGSGGVSIVNAGTGEQITRIPGKRSPNCSLAFSPCSDRLAVGDREVNDSETSSRSARLPSEPGRASIRVYSLFDKKPLMKLECGNRTIAAIAFGQDGSDLFAAVDDEVKVWNLREARSVVLEPADNLTTLTFDKSGEVLATVHDSHVVVRNASTGKPEQTLTLEDVPGSVHDVAFDQSSQTIAAAYRTGIVAAWHVKSGVLQQTYQAKRSCFRVRFDPAGKFVAAGGYDATVWDRNSGEVLHEWSATEGSSRWTPAIAFSPAGGSFAIACRGDGVRIRVTGRRPGAATRNSRSSAWRLLPVAAISSDAGRTIEFGSGMWPVVRLPEPW